MLCHVREVDLRRHRAGPRRRRRLDGGGAGQPAAAGRHQLHRLPGQPRGPVRRAARTDPPVALDVSTAGITVVDSRMLDRAGPAVRRQHGRRRSWAPPAATGSRPAPGSRPPPRRARRGRSPAARSHAGAVRHRGRRRGTAGWSGGRPAASPPPTAGRQRDRASPATSALAAPGSGCRSTLPWHLLERDAALPGARLLVASPAPTPATSSSSRRTSTRGCWATCRPGPETPGRRSARRRARSRRASPAEPPSARPLPLVAATGHVETAPRDPARATRRRPGSAGRWCPTPVDRARRPPGRPLPAGAPRRPAAPGQPRRARGPGVRRRVRDRPAARAAAGRAWWPR